MLNTQDRETLIKLKLISSIKISEKISTHYLVVQADSYHTKISRWLYGENKGNTVIFCRNTIIQSLALLRANKDEDVKKNIIKDLMLSQQGLENLQETYSDSVRVVSELAQIKEVITRELTRQPSK
jgi:hypothetical protein